MLFQEILDVLEHEAAHLYTTGEKSYAARHKLRVELERVGIALEKYITETAKEERIGG